MLGKRSRRASLGSVKLWLVNWTGAERLPYSVLNHALLTVINGQLSIVLHPLPDVGQRGVPLLELRLKLRLPLLVLPPELINLLPEPVQLQERGRPLVLLDKLTFSVDSLAGGWPREVPSTLWQEAGQEKSHRLSGRRLAKRSPIDSLAGGWPREVTSYFLPLAGRRTSLRAAWKFLRCG